LGLLSQLKGALGPEGAEGGASYNRLMIKPLFLLAVLTLPAAAQNRAAEIDFQNALEDARRQAASNAQALAKIETTLVAMNDGVGAGEAVVAYIRERGIRVTLATQAEAVKSEGNVITLSDALPAYPRVYGPLIASEVAKRMFADMPACAERAYMRRATAGRVWLELGGEPSSLPIVEPLTGARVDAIVAEIGSWASTDGAQMTLYKAGQAENLPELPELMDAARADQKKYADLAVANSRFVAFLLDERDVRRAAGLR
jgi:hypothetical protein